MKFVKNILIVLTFFYVNRIASQCGPLTPSFTVNLIGQPSGTYVSPSVVRADNCCGTTPPDVCIKFTIFLDPGAMGINFQIVSGAIPPGALFYQINCGPPIPVGSPICLNGPGPHILTFCKPGNNQNQFAIISVPGPVFPDSIMVRSGCTATMGVTGFSVPTITWNSINPGSPGQYNSYLSCTVGCATVSVVPTGTPPPFVDYVVGGFGQTPCQGNYYQDTVRVYFYNDLVAVINPSVSTLCFGTTNTVLTVSGSGGLPPYTYSWSTGSTSQSVSVGPGTYTVQLNDNTGCPPTTATAVVNSFSLPITANAGPDQTLCKSSPNAVINGSVTSVPGGVWSGGTGTYSPSQSSLNITYIPTPAELTAGSVTLVLTTTGNQGCPPGTDTVVLTYQNPPIVSAGPGSTVCANNNQISLNGSITGYSATPVWSTGGDGVFTSTTNLSTTNTPGSNDITAGFVNFTLTSANNGVCPPASGTVQVIITPAPVVNAGPSQTICSISSAALSGTVTGPTTTGIWTSSGTGTFSPSPTVLSASYIPSSGDVSLGNVTLTLTSTGNGNCIPVTSTLNIGIVQMASVTVNSSQTICSSPGNVNLTGIINGGTSTGSWTSNGAGTYSFGATVLNNVYQIAGSDVGLGTVVFTLSATNNSPCPVATATTSAFIVPMATVNAGPNQVICSSAGVIVLSGTVQSLNNTGSWSSNGTGSYNPNNLSLITQYSITPADISAGSVTFTLSSTNNSPCPVITDSVRINIVPLATVAVNGSQTICSTPGYVNLSGSINSGSNTGVWTTNGAGTFSMAATVLNNVYQIAGSDLGLGTVMFTLSSTNNGPCPIVTNTTSAFIVPMATVNAGPNQVICSSAGVIALSGTVQSLNNTGSWSSNGTGSYNPGNLSLTTQYSITPNDITAGSVTFTLSSTNNSPCPVVFDSVKINITPLATVAVNGSQTVCSNSGTINLNGNVSGGTSTGIWNTDGSGTFNPGNTALVNTYSFSAGDIGLGLVNFTLTSTNNGPCAAVTNTTSLTIVPLATVNAGPNQALCSTAGTIALNGSVSSLSNTGVWTSNGSGTYTPGNTNLTPTYSITNADILAGSVTFTLSSTNNSPCPVVMDTVLISIMQLPTVTASPGQTLCSTTSAMSLTGTVGGGTSSGIWSTNGSGTFNPGNTFLNNTYLISVGDISMTILNFTLSSTNNGPCPVVTSTTSLVIAPLATVNAGANQALCASQGTIALSGSVLSLSNTGVWSGNGTGSYSPDPLSLTPTYSMTQADILAGSVIFTLSSSNNDPCPIISDTVKITIKQLASVNAGTNQAICSTISAINLNGNVTVGSTTGIWSTNGTGIFIPGNTVLNTGYIVTGADATAGTVIFTLTSTNNGACPPVTDTVMLSIYPVPIVNAGPNQALCSNAGSIALTGFVNTNNGSWTSTGTGTFIPDANSLTTTYSMSATDINTGYVIFNLTSSNFGLCPLVLDSVRINIRKMASVNAGADIPVCSTSGKATLSGTVTGGTTSGSWSHNGGGTFSPSQTALSTSYNFTSQDISSGTVDVVLISTNNGICPAASDTVRINIFENPVIKMSSDTTICSYQNPFKILPAVTGDMGAVQWTSSGLGSFIPHSQANPVSYDITNDIPAGNVILSITTLSTGPCANANASIKVIIRRAPTAEYTPSTFTANIPNDPVIFTNQSILANTYVWDFGDGSFSSQTSPTHNFSDVGYYDVSLIAMNNSGCSDTVRKTILVISDIQFPNVFTPNASGSNGGLYDVSDYSNDVFFPYTSGVTEYNLKIFNRWGELIFESTDIKTGWDGYFKGKLCQQDAYVWKADVKFFDGRTYNKTGSVTLLK